MAKERDPTEVDTTQEELKKIGEDARESADKFLGSEESISGKLEEKLGEDGRSMSRSNKDFQPSVDHIESAANLTGVKTFNFQNKVLMTLGHILALLLLIPVASYIMIFDMRNISQEFVELYNNYTFTVVLIIGSISLIIVGLTDYLFLGMFNKKNKKTRWLERIILWFLLILQFASHSYFAYLNVGVQNTVKKEKIMDSSTSTEGIKSNGINDSITTINSQIEELKAELKEKSESYKIEQQNKQEAHASWLKLNRLSNPTRKQARQRRNHYTQEKNAQEAMNSITQRKKEINKEIRELTKEKLSLTNSLTDISLSVDKELDESGFWRIIYLIVLLAMFEGLSHIHWLAYYRIIKNAPKDSVEDWRELSYVLEFGTAFSNKIEEAIAVMAGQQLRQADQKLNDIKLVGKAFEMNQAMGTHTMIETTKSNVATMNTAVQAARENTKGIILLAQSIRKDGLGAKLGYEEREDGKTVELKADVKKLVEPTPSLVEALSFLNEEFQPFTKPTLKIAAGEAGGYCDPLTDVIVIGENESEKLSVLAHEFTHHLGYVKHDKEFRELEEVVMKGLEQWLRTRQKQ